MFYVFYRHTGILWEYGSVSYGKIGADTTGALQCSQSPTQ